MTTTYPGAIDSFDTHVDSVDDVMAADVNNLNDAVVALETAHRDQTLMRVKNTSGSTVAANDLGYINYAGEFKLTNTAYHDVAWAVVVEGAANNSDIIVTNKGLVTVVLNANCSIGDYLYTSTTSKQAQPQSYMRPEVFAVAKTANAAGAGGTCEALLLCNTVPRAVAPTEDLYKASSLSDSDFVSTIATLPGGAVLTYGAVTSGTEANIVPTASTQLAKMVLHNTTRSNDALISDVDTGTNTITLTAAVPGDWQVGDTITMRSQTNTTNPTANVYFADLEITSDADALAQYIVLYIAWRDSGAANLDLTTHPYKTNANSNRRGVKLQVANVYTNTTTPPIPLLENRFCMSWAASGAGTANTTVRLAEEGVAAP